MSIKHIIHTEEEKRKAVELNKNGMNYSQIGKILGVCKGLARRWCNPIVVETEKNHCRIYHKKWYSLDKNKTQKAAYYQDQKTNNHEHILEIKRKSREKHKGERWIKEKARIHSDPSYKLITYQRGYIKKILKSLGVNKTMKTCQYLGCTGNFLKEYLEKQFLPGMTWANHAKFGWHVDHIIPLGTIDKNNIEQIKKVFHYTNLRPLWWKDNLSRNKKYDLKMVSI